MFNFLVNFKSVFANAYIRLITILILIAVIGLSTVNAYGLSSDEPAEIGMVRLNLELIAKSKPISGDLKYYGTVFNVASEAVFQASQYIHKGFSYNPLSDLDSRDSSGQGILDRIKIKHPLTFLISLVAYASVSGIVGILCGWKFGWFGAIVLALFPQFWGHSFFNPKDIPFAAIFTLCTFLGSFIVDQYVKAESSINSIILGIKRLGINTILYGILIGLLTGIRVGGFIVMFFVLIAHLTSGIGRKINLINVLNFGIYYGMMFLAWLGTTIVCHPASWSNPFGWFFEAVKYLSKHSWSGTVLFNGQRIAGDAIPWYYLPTLVTITVPVIFIIFFLLGLILIFFKYCRFSIMQRACTVLVLLQVLFLPAVAIIRQSTIYDGLRQFLFILPGIAALSAAAIIWLYKSLPGKTFKLFSTGFLAVIFVSIILDMIALHPYQYVYFNRISGGLENAYHRYDTDYWGLSAREAMEWINENSEPNAKVLVGAYSFYSAKIFAKPDLTLLHSFNLKTHIFKLPEVSKPYYYLAIPNGELQAQLPDCKIVHKVMRKNSPLTIVKKCD